MMKRIFILGVLISIAAFAPIANAGAMRVYHSGKPAGASTPTAILPNGRPLATPMTSAMAGSGGSGLSAAAGSGRVWTDMNDGASSPYSKYNLMASRTSVGDYIRTGRIGSRGLTGVVTSTFDNQIFYNSYSY